MKQPQVVVKSRPMFISYTLNIPSSCTSDCHLSDALGEKGRNLSTNWTGWPCNPREVPFPPVTTWTSWCPHLPSPQANIQEITNPSPRVVSFPTSVGMRSSFSAVCLWWTGNLQALLHQFVTAASGQERLLAWLPPNSTWHRKYPAQAHVACFQVTLMSVRMSVTFPFGAVSGTDLSVACLSMHPCVKLVSGIQHFIKGCPQLRMQYCWISKQFQ